MLSGGLGAFSIDVQFQKDKMYTMAHFSGKLILIMMIYIAQKAQAIDNFDIVEPLPENIYPIEFTSAEVTCAASDSSGEKTPEKILFMRKDQFATYTEITANDNLYFTNRTEMIFTGEGPDAKKAAKLFVTMHIRNVTLDDDSQWGLLGRYECHAFAVNDSVERKHGFSVNVIRKEEIPKVSVPKVSILQHGDNVTTVCNVTEGIGPVTPLKRVSWYKDGVLLQTLRNPDPRNPEDFLGPLVIKNVGVRDGGEYKCLLEVLLRSFRKHNVSDTTVIRVAPWLDKPKEDLQFKKFKGDNVSFECAARGYPLQVEWKVQKESENTVQSCINESNGNYHIHRRGTYAPSVLTVYHLQYADSGFYYCCLPSNCANNVNENCQRFILMVNGQSSPLAYNLYLLVALILSTILAFTRREL